jgi:hypothetical protein
LEWNEIAEIKPKNNGLILVNADDSIRVFINSQIDDYPEVIKFIQQKLRDLLKLQQSTEFHQNIIESSFLLIFGVGLLLFVIYSVFGDGLSNNLIVPIFAALAASIFLVWNGLSKIRKLSLENDLLVIDYIFWKQQYHAKEIEAVGLEQKMNKNQISYPVYISLQKGKQIVVEKVKEGNPILLNALEEWLQKYKKSLS